MTELDLRAAVAAARLASLTGDTVTVALLIEPPWAVCFDPSAAARWFDGEIELELFSRLCTLMEPFGVRWTLVPCTGDPVPRVAALAEHSPPRWVFVRRPSLRRRRTRRLVGALRGEHGLPLFLV
ncbi:hypothetical protein [Spirillospora sp. CA-294931]|uniref:hypothetical protein n=1 Tax=Spirillospora sp. CA-294931 TaxID=3240042 RepID=UPI003D8F3819